VLIKTPEQMDLLALHRVRSRLVRQRTGVANQIRGFLLERGITVRQGFMPLRKALPEILSSKSDALSPRMINLIGELMQDWRRLDERIASVSTEIEAMAKRDESCQRLMSVPGVGPIVSSAVVAAIGTDGCRRVAPSSRRLPRHRRARLGILLSSNRVSSGSTRILKIAVQRLAGLHGLTISTFRR
jgi:transposase